MNQGPFIDPETDISQAVYAVVYSTNRKRGRFPENCVVLCADEAAARTQENLTEHRYAARLHGPCRSSEGLKLYYLIGWL